MARPIKKGLTYFPIDVDFMQDKKWVLLKSEFGARGVIVAIQIMCQIYAEEGYYKKWDNDDSMLMAGNVSCDCTSEFITDVINGCVKRGLFDSQIFQKYSILTSAGIQRRYIQGASRREEINIAKELLLLNINNPRDVPKKIKPLLCYYSIENTVPVIETLSKEEFPYTETGVSVYKNRSFRIRKLGFPYTLTPKEKNKKENEIEKEKENYFSPPTPSRAFPFRLNDILENLEKGRQNGYNSNLIDSLEKWFKYKSEKGQGYKETGYKEFMKKINDVIAEGNSIGDVCEAINKSITNNYQGVFFDKLQKSNTASVKAKNKFLEVPQRQYTEEQLRKIYDN